ncbi:MAG: pyruvate dehydrogenase E2 component (dihydrolipoamide acetyltransferase) [Gammaproteobacteria bacterium]|jgi:pyruvate dehydrogenase E2 component (dihydrolipoamide acetyltransferase)
MSKLTEVKVPDIGDFNDIEVIDVLVKVGDVVQLEDSLISLESDKATMDIPSSAAGTVKELKVKSGDRVAEGNVILIIEEAAAEKKSASRKKNKTTDKKVAAVVIEHEIKVPDIGDFKEIEVIDVMIKAGDVVELESPLISLESDKATMDIPSPFAGTISKVNVKNGDKVAEGSLIAIISVSDNASTTDAIASSDSIETKKAAAPAEAKTQQRIVEPVMPVMAAAPAASGAGGLAHASPAIRKFARELGVDLIRVQGSGRKGRIVREDVTAYTRAMLSGQGGMASHKALELFEPPVVDFSKFGVTETIALTRLNKLSSQNLHRSWVSIPHVTNFDEADITELEEYRVSKKKEAEKHGTKLTILSFLIKAVVAELKNYPRFNSSLAPNGEELIYKKYYNIGFAVNTDQGLMVPVVKNADKKGIYELAIELADLAKKARDKKLPPSDMQGACFTISSLGHIGGTGFTPIINPPEVAIMGVSRSTIKPVYVDGKIEPRLIMPFSLSYDHRVIDGVLAAEFTRALGEVLSDIRELIL